MPLWLKIVLGIALFYHFVWLHQILRAQQETNRWLALIGNLLSERG